jgi:hypothetical protein
MMGKQTDQPAFVYDFVLDRNVPADHMLWSIDRFVELDEIRANLAPFYSMTGRPSIDPECHSATGFDADRHANPLEYLMPPRSRGHAVSHLLDS